MQPSDGGLCALSRLGLGSPLNPVSAFAMPGAMRAAFAALVLAAILSGTSLALPRQAAGALETRPNVVIVLADDLGWGDLGGGDERGFRTPNLDRLAAEGVRFSDSYTAQSTCTAARAALF